MRGRFSPSPGWTEAEATIKSLSADSPLRAGMIERITMLGSDEALSWSQDEAGLRIKPPAEKPCAPAYTFKIALHNVGGLP